MIESTQEPPALSSTIRTFLRVLLLVIPTFLLYAHTLDSPFYLDDYANIVDNPSMRLTELTLENLDRAGFEAVCRRRPVANISFALNYYFHQYNLPGYHLVNILIHILTGVALCFFISATLRIPGNQWPFSQTGRTSSLAGMPIFTALIWLVHPLHTQSVTYIVQRMNSLSAMFYVIALLMYVHARLSTGNILRRLLFAATIISGILALGSKEIALTLPLLIFLYEWYFFQQLNLGWLKKQVPLILGLITVLAFVVFKFIGSNPLDYIAGSYEMRDFSLGQRVLTELRVVMHYITLLIFPHPDRLSLEYDFPLSHSLVEPVTTLFSLVAIGSVLALAVFISKRHRLAAFCILGFLGNLVIESSVLGLEIIFEHRTYLPSMFAVILFALAGYRYIFSRFMRVALFFGLVAVFSFWTHERNALWRDEVAFLTRTSANAPANWRVYSNLANALAAKERYTEALEHYEKALDLSPHIGASVENKTARSYHADLLSNIGNTLVRQGQPAEAIRYLSKALKMVPYHVKANTSMGLALEKQGDPGEAIRHYRQALQADPVFVKAHNNMGLALAAQGNGAAAIASFSRAIALKPSFAEAYNNIAVQLSSQNDLPAAIFNFSRAITIRPDYAQAHYNLGLSLFSSGKTRAAGASFKQALVLRPDFIPAQKGCMTVAAREREYESELKRLRGDIAGDPGNPALYGKLGDLYKRNGNWSAAVLQYEKAAEIQPDDIPGLKRLAIACAVAGDYGRALAIFKRLSVMQPENADPYYNVASIYARQRETEKAVIWLENAIERGYSDWPAILADRNLEAIRDTVAFQELKNKHGDGRNGN